MLSVCARSSQGAVSHIEMPQCSAKHLWECLLVGIKYVACVPPIYSNDW